MMTQFRIFAQIFVLTLTLAVSSLIPFSSSAFADFKVKFDCYMPEDLVNCAELEKSFYGQFGYLSSPASVAETELIIQVRSNPIAVNGTTFDLGTAYSIDFLGSGELPRFTIIDRVPQQVSSDNRFIRVLANLNKGLAPFLALKEPAKTVSGETSMVFKDPHQGPATTTQSGTSRFYMAPSLSGGYSKTQIEEVSARGTLYFNWSGDRIRAQSTMNGNYAKVVMNFPGSAPITATVVSAGAQTIVSYSIANHWSLAVIASTLHKPALNQNLEAIGAVGVEWVMVPFMKTTGNNLSFRYAVGAEYEDFVARNIKGDDRALFAQHLVEAYLAWHFQVFDVGFKAGASSQVDNLDYLKVYSSLDVTVRLTKSLTMGVSLSASQQKHMVNQPETQDTSNPVQSLISGSQYSNTSIASIVKLTYLFGNSTLNVQDQRWKGFGM